MGRLHTSHSTPLHFTTLQCALRHNFNKFACHLRCLFMTAWRGVAIRCGALVKVGGVSHKYFDCTYLLLAALHAYLQRVNIPTCHASLHTYNINFSPYFLATLKRLLILHINIQVYMSISSPFSSQTFLKVFQFSKEVHRFQ